MKKCVFLVVLAVMPIVCAAQYYNPYGSYQQQRQMNQQAFEWGKKMMEETLENHEQQLKQNPLMLGGVAVEDMAYGRYSNAYERFEYLANNYNDARAWLYLGYMNELGMGTSKSYEHAKTCYAKGANLGLQECTVELQRIKQGNYLGSEYKQIFRGYFQNIVAMQSAYSGNWGSGNNNGGYIGNGNNGVNSDRLTCPTCHGTKHCTMCAGRGEYLSNGRYYDCDMCHGGGACYGCHGRGWIR